jgi:hypothetical protein
MKIIVESEELKQEILKQSEYIHDFLINKDDIKEDWVNPYIRKLILELTI